MGCFAQDTEYYRCPSRLLPGRSGHLKSLAPGREYRRGGLHRGGPTPQNTHPARFSTLDSGSEGGTSPWR